MSIENSSSNDKKSEIWKFCPRCGTKLPETKKVRYCTGCGLDLEYFKEHKMLPPR